MITFLVFGTYLGLVVDDYIQTIKRSSMKSGEVVSYIVLRFLRDVTILAGILWLFYIAGLGYLDKYL